MSRRICLVALGFILVILIARWGLSFYTYDASPVVHGYDGPTATIESMVHQYPIEIYSNYQENVGLTSAEFDPGTSDLFDIGIASGIRWEIQGAPNVMQLEHIDTIQQLIVDDTSKTNMSKTWQVYIAHCQMGLAVSSWRGGVAESYPCTLWLQVEENPYTVFSNADENLVYTISVFTQDKFDATGDIEVKPQSTAYDFPLDPIGEGSDTPQWVLDSGYTSNLKYFEKVRFPLEVHSADPVEISLEGRIEASGEWDIGIDMLMFGYWEHNPHIRKSRALACDRNP